MQSVEAPHPAAAKLNCQVKSPIHFSPAILSLQQTKANVQILIAVVTIPYIDSSTGFQASRINNLRRLH